tara:strand:+ start:599 stop:1534 length:936 start_codon:yes stop_codon:yes gene_type:complete
MSGTYLTLVNKTLARLNEVQLTANTWSSARGIQVQAKHAVNESIRYINQREFNYPFNHATASQTLTAGVVRYSLPSSTKTVDYNSVRLVKDSDLGTSGGRLGILAYNDYVNNYITQEDEIASTTLNGSHSSSVGTLTLTSSSDFDSSGTIYIGGEQVTYTGTTGNDLTGCTRGANSTTAATHASGTTVTQFTGGGIPRHIARTADNGYLLYPFPTKQYTLKFDYYTFPTDLDATTDTTSIPARFDMVIVDGATAFVYQYRGETQQYQINFARYEQGIKNMQTLLVNKFDYLRSTLIPRTSSSFMDVSPRVS